MAEEMAKAQAATTVGGSREPNMYFIYKVFQKCKQLEYKYNSKIQKFKKNQLSKNKYSITSS